MEMDNRCPSSRLLEPLRSAARELPYACAIMWMSWLYSKTTVPAFALFLTSGLSWFNAQYYTKQSVANFAICHTFGHVEERISMTTGMPVPEWGKEAKKPQNTMS